jgi:hypothetical protein
LANDDRPRSNEQDFVDIGAARHRDPTRWQSQPSIVEVTCRSSCSSGSLFFECCAFKGYAQQAELGSLAGRSSLGQPAKGQLLHQYQ